MAKRIKISPRSNIVYGKIWKNGKHLFQYCGHGYRYFLRKHLTFEFMEERVFDKKPLSAVKEVMTNCLLSRTANKPSIDWKKIQLSSIGNLLNDI